LTFRHLSRRLFASHSVLAAWAGIQALTSGGSSSGAITSEFRHRPRAHDANLGPEIQSILDELNAPAKVILPPADYMARARDISSYFFANTRRGTYAAIELNKSHVIFDGFAATLRAKGRTHPSADDIQPVMATSKNIDIGTLVDIGFLGLAFDTNNDGDTINSNQRAPYLMGVDGLKFLSTICHSSGERRGSGPYLHNNHNVQILGHRHQKVTSGGNRRYNENLVEVGGIYYDFSEAIDLDGINWQIVHDAMVFESVDRKSQALDANSVVNGVFANMAVKLTGQFININHKNTTPPTFAQYVVPAWAADTRYAFGEKSTNDRGKEYVATASGVSAKSGGPTGSGHDIRDGTVVWDYVQRNPSTVTPSQRVVVSNIVGEQIGSATNPVIAIGTQWANAHPGTRCEHDITLCNFMFEDTSYLAVNEASNLTLDNFYMGKVIVPDTAAALYMFSATSGDEQLAWSDLDVVLKYGTIRTSERGILRVHKPRRIVIDHLRGSDLQTLAKGEPDIDITGLETRGAYVEIDGLDCPGDVVISGNSALIAAWTAETAYVQNKIVSHGGKYYRCRRSGISASGPVATTASVADGSCVWEWMPEPYTVLWGKRNQLRGALTLKGDVHQHIHGENVQCPLPDLDMTGTVTRVLYIARRRCTIARVTLSVANNIFADANNYRAVRFKRQRDGTATPLSSATTASGWPAFAQIDCGFPGGAALEIGDVVYFDSSATGSGAALTGMCLSLDVLEY
jgi:hypothetical protein